MNDGSKASSIAVYIDLQIFSPRKYRRDWRALALLIVEEEEEEEDALRAAVFVMLLRALHLVPTSHNMAHRDHLSRRFRLRLTNCERLES